MWKKLKGKSPDKRTYAPKLVEHLYIVFASITITVCLMLFFLKVFKDSSDPLQKLWDFLNSLYGRAIVVVMLFSYLTILWASFRVIYWNKKTEEGKIFVIFEIIFALLFVTTFLAIIFAILALKYNELVYL
ncbi:hypothetical protein ACW95P_03475 [Candidatus Mycoplasma pogonae]